MKTLTNEELATMIAALESQPHLSLKEQKYLAALSKLQSYEDCPPFAFYGQSENDGAYYNTASAAFKDGCDTVTPLFEKV